MRWFRWVCICPAFLAPPACVPSREEKPSARAESTAVLAASATSSSADHAEADKKLGGEQSAIGAEPSPLNNNNVVVDLFEETLAGNLALLNEALEARAAPITSLSLHVGWGCEFGDKGIKHLLEHPKLALRALSIHKGQITHIGLDALLSSPVAASLESLDLTDNYLGVESAQLLASTAQLTRLRHLGLARTYLHADGAKALAQAQGLSLVEELDLGHNFIGVEGARALAASSAFPALRKLGLDYNYIGNDGAIALSAAPHFTSLSIVDLQANEIALEGAMALANRSMSPSAPMFLVEGNTLDESDIRSLAAYPRIDFREKPLFYGGGGGGSFPRPKSGAPSERAAAAPPPGFPETIDFREIWIWEFGLVAQFPTFMTIQEPPGNGKSRTFRWLDAATLTVGGWYTVYNDTLLDLAKPECAAVPKARIRVEPLSKNAVLVRCSDPNKTIISWLSVDGGTVLHVSFEYATKLDAYFAPIAARVVRSAYVESNQP